MKVLLISSHRPGPSKWGQKLNDLQPLYLPLGLAYVAAASEKTGAETRVIDFNATPFDESEFKKFLLDFRPDVVGIQILIMSYGNSKTLAGIVKRTLPSAAVVVGGPLASVRGKELLDECADFDILAVGEGDLTFPELLKTLGDGRDLGGVAGICHRKGGETVFNGYRYPLPDLDEIPFPARRLFQISRYRVAPLMRGHKTMDLVTSRGCPFRCAFCHSGALSPVFRYQSPQKTVREIGMLKEEFGADSLLFHDDILTANKKVIGEMCDRIIAANLVMPWSCLTHANCLNEELLLKMKAAGCYQVWFGVESGNQRLLDFINKRLKLDTVREMFALCNKHRIMTRALFIIGLPGETREDTLRTIDFAIELKPCFAQFSLASPLKGTEMHRQMAETSPELGKILELDDDRYDIFANIVYVPAGRTVSEMRATHKLAYRRFYLRPAHAVHILPYLFKFPLRNLLKILKAVIKLLILR